MPDPSDNWAQYIVVMFMVLCWPLLFVFAWFIEAFHQLSDTASWIWDKMRGK